MASVPYDGDSLVPLSEVLDFYTTVDNPGAGHNHNPCDRNEAPEFDSSADAAELDTHALGLEVSDSEVQFYMRCSM